VACLRKDVRVGLGVSAPLSPVIDELDKMIGPNIQMRAEEWWVRKLDGSCSQIDGRYS